MWKMELLLQVPKCSKLPFFSQGWWRTKYVLRSSNCSGPIRGPLANHLGEPLAPSLGHPYSKAQWVPMGFHHPLNIHQSQASKVQYILYPTDFSPLLLCKACGSGPNRGSDLSVIWSTRVSYVLRELLKCKCSLSHKNIVLIMTWSQI